MIDPALLTRLAAILPGEWTTIRDGYALATGADNYAATTPYSPHLVRVGDGGARTTNTAADPPTLIRRVLGDAVFTAIADPTSAAKVERDRRRSELNHLRQTAEAALHQAQDNLAAIEAQIAAFDRENAP